MLLIQRKDKGNILKKLFLLLICLSNYSFASNNCEQKSIDEFDFASKTYAGTPYFSIKKKNNSNTVWQYYKYSRISLSMIKDTDSFANCIKKLLPQSEVDIYADTVEIKKFNENDLKKLISIVKDNSSIRDITFKKVDNNINIALNSQPVIIAPPIKDKVIKAAPDNKPSDIDDSSKKVLAVDVGAEFLKLSETTFKEITDICDEINKYLDNLKQIDKASFESDIEKYEDNLQNAERRLEIFDEQKKSIIEKSSEYKENAELYAVNETIDKIEKYKNNANKMIVELLNKTSKKKKEILQESTVSEEPPPK
jgi:hypothetical protein